MKIINATVSSQKLTLSTNSIQVAGSVGLYGVDFSFDAEWNNVTTKVVVFNSPNVTKPVSVEYTGSTITLPWETITKPCVLEIGVLGYTTTGNVHTLQITTHADNGSNLLQILNMTTDGVNTADPFPEPTPGAYEILSGKIGNLATLKTTDKTSLVNAINEVFESGGGGEISTIKVNGQVQPIVSKTVDISVPTKTSQLSNDSGFVTSAQVPNKTSQLTNDSNFVADSSYVHTDNNYTTTEKTKLAGIEEGAQKNANNTVIDASYVHTDNNYTSAEKQKLANTPTVYDTTITITQGGVTKGSFTTNQSTAGTIALDAGGSDAIWGNITGTLSNQSDLQTALNGKVSVEQGKGLSTNDYTTAEKTKLSGVAENAQVNVLEGVQVGGTDATITNKKVNLPTTTFTFTLSDNTTVTYDILGGLHTS